MMALDVRSPDRVQRVALLGMRFRDDAMARPVTDGLVVVVSDTRRPNVSVSTVRSPSGVEVLHAFPGLADLARGSGDDAYWQHVDALAHRSPPGLPTLRVRVDDAQGRFLPTRFDVVVPHRGLSSLGALLSSPDAESDVPLYSRPSRATGGSVAVIRAQLRDDTRARFAAWALVTIAHGGVEIGRGIADEAGRVVVFCPYPQFPVAGMSPSMPPIPEWTLEFGVAYAGHSEAEVPDLADLHRQPAVDVVGDVSPPAERIDVELGFGQEAIVRSPGSPYLHLMPH
jgi:hypothetical protein